MTVKLSCKSRPLIYMTEVLRRSETDRDACAQRKMDVAPNEKMSSCLPRGQAEQSLEKPKLSVSIA